MITLFVTIYRLGYIVEILPLYIHLFVENTQRENVQKLMHMLSEFVAYMFILPAVDAIKILLTYKCQLVLQSIMHCTSVIG